MKWSFRGFLSQGGTPLSLRGLFHGKSQNKMDENWIPVLANLHNLFFWLFADFKAIIFQRGRSSGTIIITLVPLPIIIVIYHDNMAIIFQ